MALTLWGAHYSSYQLRQIAGELEQQLKQIDDVSETKIIGGLPRQVRVVLDSQRLAAYGMTAGAVTAQLEQANARSSSGSFAQDNREFQVEAGRFLGSADDLKQVVVGVSQGKPVYLRDVAAEIVDGPAEPKDYVLYANAAGAPKVAPRGEYPAVTITLAKRKGTNATVISEAAEKKIAELRGYLLPSDLNCHGHAQLRRDRQGQVRRAAEASVPGYAVGHAADCLGAGLARIGCGADRHSRYPGADPVHLLHLRLHAEPGHALRAHLLHRHPGGRCNCRGGKRSAALPLAIEQRPTTVRCSGRSGGRSRQSHHPRDLRRDCRHSAHGLCARTDGSVHAAYSCGCIGSNAVLADRGFRGIALGGTAAAAPLRFRRRTPARNAKAGPRVSTAAS